MFSYLVGGGGISRQSKKQAMVTFSSIEFEYIFIASTAKEAIQFCQLFNDLGFNNQNLYHYIVIINHV
jgi:hypothetical protein